MLRVLPDGRILANVIQFFAGGFHGRYVTRLLADGSTDGAFTNIVYDGGRLITTFLRSLAPDPVSGKLYAAYVTYNGPSQTASINRYNSDGTVDSTWERPAFSPSTYLVNSIAVQGDGAAILSGRFDTVNGLGKVNLVRLQPTGNVDPTFNPPALGNSAGQITLVSGGKIIVATDAATANRPVRLNPDGSLDATFVLSPLVSSIVNLWAAGPGERLHFLASSAGAYRYFRLEQDGSADPGFSPGVALFGRLQTVARQPDGKILVAGTFSQMNGTAKAGMARLNADGTLDAAFDVGSGFNSIPRSIAVQNDGKIIVAGAFSAFNGRPSQAIVRLDPNGSVDAAFAPLIPAGQSVGKAFVQADGKILIAGTFNSVNDSARTAIARLNSDGTLDAFAPTIGTSSLTDVFQQPDGLIMVAGNFSGVNGFNRSGLARLNPDGTLDQSFNASAPGNVFRAWLQPDGRYFYTTTNSLFRRTSTGALDNSFTSPVFDTTGSNGRSLDWVSVQPDGTYIVAGRFDLVGGATRRNIVRLTSTGMVDPLFAPNGTDQPVKAMLRQPDGKLIIAGDFTRVENVVRAGSARLNVPDYRPATPFDFDGDGRADIAVYRPSSGVWYQLFSSGQPYGSPTFGLSGDIPTPADFDGDGRTDIGIFRPSTGTWWYTSSATGQQRAAPHGQAGDIPLPSDINGDGTDDFVVYRPSSGVWLRVTTTGQFSNIGFGISGDIPVIGDFDGDGKADPAIFRPSNGDWWYAASGAAHAHRTLHWGATGDIPVAADYDGDAKTDFAVFRPSTGVWYIFRSSDLTYVIQSFGLDGDRPVAADYDGDGRADLAIFRPSTGIWWLLQSTSGSGGVQWGVASDVAIPNAFTAAP